VAAVTASLTEAGLTVLTLASLADPPSALVQHETPGRIAVLGDVDDWQSRWGAIAALRPVAELVFDACSPADLRALTRVRDLPPPLGRGEVWRFALSGVFERSTLPRRAAAEN
jgi:S-DNA-T family DNA segregation ATPase FtsK/SpoIIIE